MVVGTGLWSGAVNGAGCGQVRGGVLRRRRLELRLRRPPRQSTAGRGGGGLQHPCVAHALGPARPRADGPPSARAAGAGRRVGQRAPRAIMSRLQLCRAPVATCLAPRPPLTHPPRTAVTAKVGPLHWHDPAAGLLRLTLREVRALLEHHGAPLRPPPPRRGATHRTPEGPPLPGACRLRAATPARHPTGAICRLAAAPRAAPLVARRGGGGLGRRRLVSGRVARRGERRRRGRRGGQLARLRVLGGEGAA